MWLRTWDTLHPAVLHLPIALLLMAPVFVVLALGFPKNSRVWGTAALVLMLAGTVASYVAVSAGHTASEYTGGNREAEAVLEYREELGELTRTVFALLTVIYAVILLVPAAIKKELARVPATVVGVAFLLLYAGGAVLLLDAGRDDGRLARPHGLHAAVAPPVSAASVALAHEKREEHHDHD